MPRMYKHHKPKRVEGRGLGERSTRLMEHIRDIRGDARHKARSVGMKKRAFGQSVASHLTMLRLYRGPSVSAAALERVLIRTLRPSGNRVGIGPPAVPKSAVAVRGPPQPWHRVPAPLLMRNRLRLLFLASLPSCIVRRRVLFVNCAKKN